MASAVCSPFNNNLHNAIQNSKVLVVGAGGIGCEILKNLVLSDFKYIEIVSINELFLNYSYSYSLSILCIRSIWIPLM